MNFIILTLFPDMISSMFGNGVLKRAVDNGGITVTPINIRDFAEGKHRITDDRPYGGGCGMVMKPEPMAAAIRSAKKEFPEAYTILLTPQGRVFNQQVARDLLQHETLLLICGRYEGIDERIREEWVNDEVSIGDYILTGGEPAALVMIDAVSRLIPGILGGESSAEEDSFSDGLLEYPHYTRPRSFEGAEVPNVLLSGDHEKIRQWRRKSSLMRTILKRPELLESSSLAGEDIDFLEKLYARIATILKK
ncbi:MAG: tRNA (guanosine(37)-N1)-methyltransferase TrmD [Deltaproteobacteria bacterium]|nr:tRNA (guanosine(37)-N1)-methyltransferase TrmD [Deltaproteobacteria bacterium]